MKVSYAFPYNSSRSHNGFSFYLLCLVVCSDLRHSLLWDAPLTWFTFSRSCAEREWSVWRHLHLFQKEGSTRRGEKMTANKTEWRELVALWLQGSFLLLNTRASSQMRREGDLMHRYAYPFRHTTEHVRLIGPSKSPVMDAERAGVMINGFWSCFCVT